MDKKWEKTYAMGKIVADIDKKNMPMDKKNMPMKKKKMPAYASMVDLEPMDAIFLTTGEANLNDDYFDAEEVRLALHTIPNKPTNLAHKAEKIVGHMHDAELLNDQFQSTADYNPTQHDQYYWGETDTPIQEDPNALKDNHAHSWSLFIDSSGKLIQGYTSWEMGHRHYITSGGLKNGKTSPGGLGHVHNLLGLEDSVKELVVVAEEKPRVNTERIHVLSHSYLYKSIFPKEVADVIEGAQTNSKFVSMETWFSGFDYLVGNKVIARNDETKFLDASLKAYGGPGNFDGADVKRVLRNLHFGGQGIVDSPANPESVIIAEKIAGGEQKKQFSEQEIVSARSTIDKNRVLITETNIQPNSREQVMADATTEVKVDKKRLDDALSAEATALKEQADKLAATVAKKDTDIANLTKAVEVSAAENESLKKNLAEVQKEISDIKLTQLMAARKSDFSSFDISDADVVEVLEEVKSMDDASYAKYLARAKRTIKAKVVAAVVPVIKTEAEIAVAAQAALQTAIANKEPAVITSGSDEDPMKVAAQQVMASIFSIKKETK